MKLPMKIGGLLLLFLLLQGTVSFIVHHLPVPFDPAQAGENVGEVIHYAAYARAWLPEAVSGLILAALIFFLLHRTVAAPMARLQERERFYRSILFGVSDDIIVLDRKCRIRDLNREKAPGLDVPREAAIGRSLRDVFPGKSDVFKNGKTEEMAAAVFKTRTPRQHRRKTVDRDGRGMWQDIRITPMTGEDGETIHAILTVRDVTREMRLEDQLRRSQKLEAIGTLAGGIAHDFNNLLMTILLNVEYVLAKSPEESAQRECMEMALAAGRHAADLVDQILTFSRNGAISQKPLAIAPLVKETMKMLRASLPATIGIRRRIDAAAERVLADPSQIQRIVVNFCANAADAMPDGGVLSVELAPHRIDPADPVAASASCRRDYLRLTVSDTGPAMPESVRDKIFDPFFATRSRRGSGMDPAAAHGAVKGMEGALLVCGASEKGNRFDILLPVYAPEERGDEVAAFNGDGRGTGRILVVDDDNTVVQILTRTLSEAGYDVTGEATGEAAFERFKASPEDYDLLITDLTMPGMTGTDLCRKIQAVRPDLPLVMTTGYGEALSPAEARRMGIRELLSKPVSGNRLLSVAREMLRTKN